MRRLLVLVLSGLALAAPAQAAVSPIQISRDPFGPNVGGQHATEAEPDSFAFGNTVVAVFQVGRYATGAAAAIGFATSLDGGHTWTSGILPSQTPFTTPPGPYSRVSDPVVAYDRVHGVWLISILALKDARGVVGTSALVTYRSPDGLTWTEPPITTSPDIGSFTHDKNWIVCDNWATSRFAGRCYTFWMHVPSESIVASTSLDGGATWGAPVSSPTEPGNGAQPVIRPDGTIVVPYLTHRGAINSFTSTDGAATFSGSTTIQRVTQTPNFGLRAPPLPSAEVAGDGRVFVAWHSCDDRPGCFTGAASPAPKGILFSSSADGVTWTPPQRLPLGTAEDGHRLLPGLGVDTTSSGETTRLALVYYVISPFPCFGECTVRAFVATSGTAGRMWSAPAEVTPRPMSIAWIPDTPGGRMLGDYLSTSFVTGGNAVAVFAAALPPALGLLEQGMYAAVVPQLGAARVRLTATSFSADRPRAGSRFTATLVVRRSDGAQVASTRVTCTARVATRALRAVVARASGDRAVCTWRVPPRTHGNRITGSVTLQVDGAVARRPFSLRIT